jgi:hypothetical protein
VSALRGADQLRRRLQAVRGVFRTLAPDWQEATARAARPMIPVRTGETRRSIRAGRVTGMKATVVGKYTINFIDAGSKAHSEPRQAGFTKSGRVSRRKVGSGKVLKFNEGGQTLFRRKVNKPRIAAHPFKREAAEKGLRSVSPLRRLIDLWNRAA